MGPANADLPTGNRRLRWPLGALLLVACASVIAGSGCATGHQGSPALRARSDKLVVGAIHVGSIDDKGYNQAMHEGLMAMKESLPNVELIEVENIPESQDAETAMEKLAGQGAHLIFPMSFGYLQYALNVAKRHPEVIFEHPGGTARSDNLGTF